MNAHVPEPQSLRERKKALTRQAIIDAAEQLFEQRGFDAVTVAEIADHANVSVKTLFVYFRSKEDLAFADTWLIDSILEAISTRSAGRSPTDAVADMLITAIETNDDHDGGLEAFHRGFDAPGLQSGLLRMWAHYEDQVTAVLIGERAGSAVDARLSAMHAISLARLVTSREVFDELDTLSADRGDAWLISIVRSASDTLVDSTDAPIGR